MDDMDVYWRTPVNPGSVETRRYRAEMKRVEFLRKNSGSQDKPLDTFPVVIENVMIDAEEFICNNMVPTILLSDNERKVIMDNVDNLMSWIGNKWMKTPIDPIRGCLPEAIYRKYNRLPAKLYARINDATPITYKNTERSIHQFMRNNRILWGHLSPFAVQKFWKAWNGLHGNDSNMVRLRGGVFVRSGILNNDTELYRLL